MLRFSFFLFFFLGITQNVQAFEYKLGEGLQVGDLPLYVGGYTSVKYTNISDGRASLALDELAFMAYGEYNNFSYMLELEADDVYVEVFGDEASDIEKEDFHIERLYLTYEFNENYALMVGKYNSPIGFWNRIPINALRDTSSRPIISTRLFPQFTSGADLRYNVQNTYDITIDTLVQQGEDLDNLLHENVYNNFDTDSHYGLGFLLQRSAWSYQLNAGYFHLTSGEEYTYLLAAFKYENDAFKIQSEIGTQFDADGTTIPYIGYLQGSYTLKEKHEFIVRLETYHDDVIDVKDSFAVIGYTYRPLYPIALKGEYQWHELHEENQFLLSVSILF